MTLSKLVFIASLALTGATAVQAAPDTAAIAAQIQASALPSPPPDATKKSVKEYIAGLTPKEQKALYAEFKDLTPAEKKAVVKWYKNLPASPT